MRGVLFRLAGSLPALVAVVIVTFILTRVLPGDTATYFAGPTASAESIAQIRTALGLDRRCRSSSGAMSSRCSMATSACR